MDTKKSCLEDANVSKELSNGKKPFDTSNKGEEKATASTKADASPVVEESNGFSAKPNVNFQFSEKPNVDFQAVEKPNVDFQAVENTNVDFQFSAKPNVDFHAVEKPNVDFQAVEKPNVDFQAVDQSRVSDIASLDNLEKLCEFACGSSQWTSGGDSDRSRQSCTNTASMSAEASFQSSLDFGSSSTLDLNYQQPDKTDDCTAEGLELCKSDKETPLEQSAGVIAIKELKNKIMENDLQMTESNGVSVPEKVKPE